MAAPRDAALTASFFPTTAVDRGPVHNRPDRSAVVPRIRPVRPATHETQTVTALIDAFADHAPLQHMDTPMRRLVRFAYWRHTVQSRMLALVRWLVCCRSCARIDRDDTREYVLDCAWHRRPPASAVG